MAQKMAPGRAKKASKKPTTTTRKAAPPTASAKAAKPKVKGVLPKAQAKHVRKPAPAKQQKQAAPAIKPPSTKRPIESQTGQAKEATKSGVPASKHMTPTKRVIPTATPRPAAPSVGAR